MLPPPPESTTDPTASTRRVTSQTGKKSMLTKQQIEGGWTQLKGEAKQQWGELNDDELRQFDNRMARNVLLIRDKGHQNQSS